MVKSYDNILIINSGIEKENVDKCLKLIRKCMKEMREGKFTDEVITSSKNTITSSIKASFDNPIGVINSYFSKILVGSDDPLERIDKFNNITKEELVKVSKKVNFYTVLTLEKGEENEED